MRTKPHRNAPARCQDNLTRERQGHRQQQRCERNFYNPFLSPCFVALALVYIINFQRDFLSRTAVSTVFPPGLSAQARQPSLNLSSGTRRYFHAGPTRKAYVGRISAFSIFQKGCQESFPPCKTQNMT
eukprot:g47203.t1